jgi:hypothetical protein
MEIKAKEKMTREEREKGKGCIKKKWTKRERKWRTNRNRARKTSGVQG